MSANYRVLVLLFIFAILGVLYYYLPFQMLENQENALIQEVATLEITYQNLQADIRSKEAWEDAMAEAEVTLDAIALRLPQNLPQEDTIALVYDMEQVLALEIRSFAMSDETVVSGYAEGVVLEDETLLAIEQEDETAEYAIEATLSAQVMITYEQLKEVLRYVNENPYRMVLNNLALISDPQTGEINTTIYLTRYGLRLFGRAPIEAYLEDFTTGKPSVFYPYEAYQEHHGVTLDQEEPIEATLEPEEAVDEVVEENTNND